MVSDGLLRPTIYYGMTDENVRMVTDRIGDFYKIF